MQLKMTIEEYIRQEFTPDSRPHRSTVMRWLNAGVLAGQQIGTRWYIIKDVSTGDYKADEILRKWNNGTAQTEKAKR